MGSNRIWGVAWVDSRGGEEGQDTVSLAGLSFGAE